RDDERLRVSRHLIVAVDRVGRVEQDLEAEAETARVAANRVSADHVVDAHRHDAKIAVGHLLMETLEARHLDFARLAPRRPDVQHDDLASVIVERAQAIRAVHGPRPKPRGARSDLHGKELVAHDVRGGTKRARLTLAAECAMYS